MDILCDVFLNNTVCKQCGECGLQLETERRIGLATVFKLKCEECDFSITFCNSPVSQKYDNPRSKVYDINVRLVYALRAIGKGAAGGAVLCGLMNLPPPFNKFAKYNEKIGDIAEDVAIESMNKATEEAVAENDNSRDISAG